MSYWKPFKYNLKSVKELTPQATVKPRHRPLPGAISRLLFGVSRCPTLPSQFVGYDYDVTQGLRLRPLRPLHSKVVLASALLTVVPLAWLFNGVSVAYDEPLRGDQQLTYVQPTTAHKSPSSNTTGSTTSTSPWLQVRIQAGDTLPLIFEQYGLSRSQLRKIMRADEYGTQLSRLRPGQELQIKQDEQGNVDSLVLTLDLTKELHIYRYEEGFAGEMRLRNVQTEIVAAYGNVDDTLLAAGQEAGLSDRLIAELVEIFHLDLDFDPIDYFVVVYEQHSLDGAAQEGNIIAAELTSQGKLYRALRYTDSQGRTNYYKPNGEPMFGTANLSNQINILQEPLEYTKVSSPYGMRVHPRSRRLRFHNGVDLAAPTGTLVNAAAEATVEFVGWKRGYGKTIILQHDEHSETLYAHLSDYASVAVGQKVKQGELIGYVGRTGRTTGSHLHYEVRIDGTHQNPLETTTLLDKDIRLTETDKADFFSKTTKVLAQLENNSRMAHNNKSTLVAKAAPVFPQNPFAIADRTKVTANLTRKKLTRAFD